MWVTVPAEIQTLFRHMGREESSSFEVDQMNPLSFKKQCKYNPIYFAFWTPKNFFLHH